MLELLALLFGMEQAVREQKALERRLREARLPKQKTAADYDFKFPKRIPKATIMRLFDCDFIERHECAVFMGPPELASRIFSPHWDTRRPSVAIRFATPVLST